MNIPGTGNRTSSRNADLYQAVISGDAEQYQWQFNKLTQLATSVAYAKFSSTTLINDAVEKAMNKVEDFLHPDSIQNISLPWDYATTTIIDSVIDLGRTCKLVEVGITKVRDTTDREKLCSIDDSIRKEFIQFDDDEKGDDGSGYSVFQINEKRKPLERDDDSYHPHEWIETLNQVLSHEWWWSIEGWEGQVKSERNKTMQSWDGVYKEADERFYEDTQKLWGNLHIINHRISDIKNDKTRRIMEAYLSGLKQVELARDFNVSESYISQKVVNNYLGEWGWSLLPASINPDIKRARLLKLTNYLASQYKKACESRVQGGWLLLGELTPPSSDKPFNFDDFCYCWNPFYTKIIKAPQSKVFFGNLERKDLIAFVDLCSSFYSRWYCGRRPRKGFG